MAAAPKINTDPSYRDIDRSVLRVMEPAGRAYWAWVGFCFTLVGDRGRACGCGRFTRVWA